MTSRELIRANLVSTCKAIAGVGAVTYKWHTRQQIDSSKMPFIMIMSDEEERERVSSQRVTQCAWANDVWCVIRPNDDLETWIEKVRAAIMANRGRGQINVLDTFIELIETDDRGIASPNQFFRMRTIVTYRMNE